MYIDDELRLILWVVAVIVALIAIIFGGAYLIDKKTCYSKYAAYQPEYVGLITGCMIIADEQRIPAESLRITM